MRGLLIALACLLASAPAVAAPRADAPEVSEQISAAQAAAAVDEAITRTRNRDARGVVELLTPIVTTPAFESLDENYRYWGYFLLGASLYDTGAFADALVHLRTATGYPQARGHDWYIRFWTAVQADNYPDAIDSMTMLSQRWPTSLQDLQEESVTRLIRRVRRMPDADARERQVLLALRVGGWRSNEPFVDQSYRWRTLARLLLEQGDVEQARVIARDVTRAHPRLTMLVDSRYDPLVSESERAQDFQALLERNLEITSALAAEHPDRLEGALSVADMLLDFGRADQAMPLIDAAIARALSPLSEGRFSDQDKWINWAYDHRARALMQLGRRDEAVEALRRGARRPENGGVNVSQTINLAELLMRVGRADEALAELAEFDEAETSPYGWMNASYVRVCAHAQRGDVAAANALAEQMRARAEDSLRVMRQTELCLGNIEGAARHYVASFERSDDLAGALWDAQEFLPRPQPTAHDLRMGEAFQIMLARPEVQAAINRHGHVLTLPLVGSGL